MKKQLLTGVAIVGLALQAFSQAFFEPVTFTGALPPVGSGAYTAVIEGGFSHTFNTGDWTQGWVNWFPNNENYRTATEVISGDITSDRVVAGDAILRGIVHVTNGATITFSAGSHIRCESGSALIIAKGSKIIAIGTPTNPIVFTSSKAAGQRAPGDWSGMLLIGNSQVNTASGKRQYEALPNDPLAEYGGGRGAELNLADNSGELRFVRIEFAGYNYLPDQELNGLTLGACGTGTRVNFVQVSYARDDAFEWFGGTSNHKYLVALGAVDDDFDMDEGYAGKVQFGIAVKNPAVFETAAGGTSNGFEHDNNTGVGTASAVVPGVNDPKPNTAPILSNISLIGPWYGLAPTSGNKFGRGLEMRSGVATSIYNSVVCGYATTLAALQHPSASVTPSTGWKLKKGRGDGDVPNASEVDAAEYRNVHLLAVSGPTTTYASAANQPSPTLDFVAYMASANGNTSQTIAGANLFPNRITNFNTPSSVDYRVPAGSLVAGIVATWTGIIAPFVGDIALAPFASVNRSALNFGTNEVGTTFGSLSFEVVASNLTGAGISINSNNSNFVVSPTNLTITGGVVTVSYTKTTAGEENGTITVNFGDSRISNAVISVKARLVDPAVPVISVDKATLAFTPNEKTTSSTYTAPAQSFSVFGRLLSADVNVTASTGYEVSTSETSGFGTSVTLTRNGKNVDGTVFVRLNGAASTGTVTVASTGAANATISLTASIGANIVVSNTGPRIDYALGTSPTVSSTNFNISGDRLPAAIVITSNSADVEVSTTSASSGYGTSATLTTTGQITTTGANVWVRYKGSLTSSGGNVQVGVLSITGVSQSIGVFIRRIGVGSVISNRWVLADGTSDMLTALGFNFNDVFTGTPDLYRASDDRYIGKVKSGGIGTSVLTLTGLSGVTTNSPYPFTFTGTIFTSTASGVVTASGLNIAQLAVGLPIHKTTGELLGVIASSISGSGFVFQSNAALDVSDVPFVTSAMLLKRNEGSISVSPSSPLSFTPSSYVGGVPQPVTRVITITASNMNANSTVNVGITPSLTSTGAMFELSLGATATASGLNGLSTSFTTNQFGSGTQLVAIRYVPGNITLLGLSGLNVLAAHSTEMLILGNGKALTSGASSSAPRVDIVYNLRGNSQPAYTADKTSLSKFLTFENYPSGIQKFTLNVLRLVTPLSISAPSNFQIVATENSATPNFSGATNSLTIEPTLDLNRTITIHVRYFRGDVGVDNGIITISADAAPSITLNVSGEAISLVPFINAAAPGGASVVSFTGTTTITVEGTNLLSDLEVMVGTGFQIGTSASAIDQTSLAFTPSPADLGDVTPKIVYVTYTASVGTVVRGNLTFKSDFAEDVVISLVGGSELVSTKKAASDMDGNVRIYPNPTSGEATIVVDFAESTKVDVDIYNISGTPVLSFYDYITGVSKYPIAGLSSGIYVVRVSAGNTVKTVRLVVK